MTTELINLKRNLSYINKSLAAENFQANKPMIIVLLLEAIEEIEATPFYYHIPYNKEADKAHFKTLISLGEKYKYQLLSDLKAVHDELTKKKPNKAFCISLLETIIKTDLYKAKVQRKLNEYKPLSRFNQFARVAVYTNQKFEKVCG